MSKIVIAYVPVLHEGYMEFFLRHRNAEALYILGGDVLNDFVHLVKDIRALQPTHARDLTKALGIFPDVNVVQRINFEHVIASRKPDVIVMPDEEVSRQVAARFLSDINVVFDSVFLMWDKKRSEEHVDLAPDRLSNDPVDVARIRGALAEAEKSSDWWRQVGAILIKEDQVVATAYNMHVPSEHTPYADGDPRGNFSRGEHIELATAFHAEQALFARCAREGISVRGTSLYVTTFPCPFCAKFIAYSGIVSLYYSSGYAILDGERILKSQGIELVFVQV